MKIGKRKVIWDLCSGLGGWTEAFVQDGWVVIRIELNPDLEYVPFTRILDVKEWMDWIDELPHPDIIVASPPCQEFSLATGKPVEGREPDMSIVRACLDIIDYIKPTWWVLENVRGATSFFMPLLGHHKQAIGARGHPKFFLWGNYPEIIMKPNFTHSISDKHTAQERALIPFELSFELLRAVKNHVRIDRWC